MARFLFTENYNADLERIEDHIFRTTDSIEQVENFLEHHDSALKFLGENSNTPAVHPVTGDQSWVFAEGRYRLFFKAVSGGNEVTVFLTHLIDNRESNLGVYPGNTIPTFQED